ncbi:hypothetical protein SAMN06265222_11550 [Neorhodopirellula lusitana]|uniref:Secreted protein n=1 Tax=Neorhodopirellula lusitana TaxID=445327 RepID=A0ABY1QIL2_9BACT|nr:hypothetical protein [Neorhodopirellula lusitana]SMP72311.1 hypothetical protein SAMN06265222_11550 [Neorhodopirellula lusitana]
MKLFVPLMFFACCLMAAGCGSDEPKLIGTGDPEGVAEYERIMAETQQMKPDEMKQIEKEMRAKR